MFRPPAFGHPEIVPPHITQRNIFRVLLLGFATVIVLFLIAGSIAMTSARESGIDAARHAEREVIAARLVTLLHSEQQVVAAVAAGPRWTAPADRERLVAELARAAAPFSKRAPAGAGITAWQELQNGASSFLADAKQALSEPAGDPDRLQTLVLLEDRMAASAAAVVGSSAQIGPAAARNRVEQRSRESAERSALLLSGSLVLALLCAVFTLRATARLVRGLESQSQELSRVTWRLLENQETAARRFSHELHDELGQTLTAIKANLAAIRRDKAQEEARLADCNALVDGAIGNVRDLSQLLHPTMLDDFGLDACLRWLAETFSQRTGIGVEYESNFNDRLDNEKETHVFRIVQEALTNVARHSGATKVRIRLERRAGRIHLSLIDNGKGIENQGRSAPGLGLTGMRARARTAGGELAISTPNGGGLAIEMWAPINAANGS